MSSGPNRRCSRSTREGGSAHHVINISPLMSELEQKMGDMPKKLNRSAGGTSSCIFRVPQSLAETNEKAYRPHILSIGPYHHGEPDFKMIEEHKGQYLNDLLKRMPDGISEFHDLVVTLAQMEESIRESYSEALDFSSHDLIQMMVLDGCFIIELFCKVGIRRPAPPDEFSPDPLLCIPWMLPFLTRDLLALENQIPYFVLQYIFENSVGLRPGNDHSLAKLALKFFNRMDERPSDVLDERCNKEAKHLLDLFRSSYIPNTLKVPKEKTKSVKLIQPAKKLHQAGVKFRPKESHSFLDIKFQCGVLQIPVLRFDDFLSSIILNFVAFEQCYHHCDKYMTSYVTFMGRLMNTPGDAGFLSDRKIVENYFGSDEEIALFFSNVGKDVVFDIHRSYMCKVFEDVNRYYHNGWHVRWAGFRHTYFNTPWSFMSALAALVLLLLTILQTFFTVYAYLRPKN